MPERDCIFCRIVANEIPSYEVYSDPNVKAFLDINPIAEGHVIVVPKEHFQGVSDADPELFLNVMDAARRISLAMVKSSFAEGTNIFIANGSVADQTVFHLHVHVLPRRNGDDINWNQWWQSKVKHVSEGVMSQIRQTLVEIEGENL